MSKTKTNIVKEETNETVAPIIANCVITETHIGFDNNKNLVMLLGLEGDGWSAPFAISYGNEVIKPYMANFIEELLSVLCIDEWDNLKGMSIRAVIDDNRISKIGHIVKNRWFSYTELLDAIISATKDTAENEA